MQLPVQTFSAIVQQMAATLQGTASQLVDLTVGSVLRALLEACASVAMWLQWLILQVLSMTRAATSLGPDLDSWMRDFSLTRLPATSAIGVVSFSRFTSGLAAFIPVGSTVRVTQGTQIFSVTAQPSNAWWNGSTGYTIPIGVFSADIPVVATVPGSLGNVQGGAIGLLSSSIPGIDTVINAQATTGGMDAESDAAFRARFQLYINSRSLATNSAVLSAIANLQQGLRYAVLENQVLSGASQIGTFCVIVDDGSGSPPSGLLSEAQTAVNAVRPIGSIFSVSGPEIIQVSVNVVIETSNSSSHSAVALLAQQSITAWITNLPIGGILAISKIEAIAHAVDTNVVSVTTVTINDKDADLVAPSNFVIIPISVVVS